MQTLILNHYPPVIKQINEIQQIAKAEDIEFSKLNVFMNEVDSNMFVYTADAAGIQRFERIFGITPKASQSLEERRSYIRFMMNRGKMSLSELESLLSEYKEVKIRPDFARDTIILDFGEDGSNRSSLYDMADEVIPLNVYIKMRTENGYEMLCLERAELCNMVITTDFRFFKTRHLDGSRYLDGTWELDGKTVSGRVHLLNGSQYLDGSSLLNGLEVPSGISIIHGSCSAVNEEWVKIYAFRMGIELAAKELAVSSFFILDTGRIMESEKAYGIVGIDCSVIYQGEQFKTFLISKKNLHYFDGSIQLDGARLLNAEITQEVI